MQTNLDSSSNMSSLCTPVKNTDMIYLPSHYHTTYSIPRPFDNLFPPFWCGALKHCVSATQHIFTPDI